MYDFLQQTLNKKTERNMRKITKILKTSEFNFERETDMSRLQLMNERIEESWTHPQL